MTVPGLLVLATARSSVADFVSALIQVYSILIIAYILVQLFLNFGGRVPYSTWFRALYDFLTQTVEPYLALFRRFIPQFGMFDLSPIVALLVLQIGGGIIVSIIRG